MSDLDNLRLESTKVGSEVAIACDVEFGWLFNSRKHLELVAKLDELRMLSNIASVNDDVK